MKYNKLIRDKIPEIIIAAGGKPISHIAKDQEYWEKLQAKLLEEANEFIADNNMEELADVLEVIDAICEYKGYSKKEIIKIKTAKRNKRGGFKKKIILDES